MSYRDSYYYDYDDRGRYSNNRRNDGYRYASPADYYYDYEDYSPQGYSKYPSQNNKRTSNHQKAPAKVSVRRSGGSWDIRDMFIAPSGGYHDPCCPHVVDPIALLAFLAAIPLVTFFLNQQIIMFIGKKKRKRNFGTLTPGGTVAAVGINGTETTPTHFGEVLISVLDQAIEVFKGKTYSKMSYAYV